MKRYGLVAILFLLVSVPVAQTTDTGQAIAVVTRDNTQYSKSLFRGANEFVNPRQITNKRTTAPSGLKIVHFTPAIPGNAESQVQAVRKALAEKVSILLLAPVEDTAPLVPVVQEAAAAGVIIVIVDGVLESEDPASTVWINPKTEGALAAKMLVAATGKRAKALILRSLEGNQTCAIREKGFLGGMFQYGPAIDIVTTRERVAPTIKETMKKVEALLKKYPDVKGLFCSNPIATAAVMQTLRDGKTDVQPILFGCGSHDVLLDALYNNQFFGTLILRDPYALGKKAMETALLAQKGEEVKSQIELEPSVLTSKNKRHRESMFLVFCLREPLKK